LQVWVKEYIALMKNPTSYHKLTDETWDFDVFMDMCFSFWMDARANHELPQARAHCHF
jgi:hypothetical protein